MGFQTFVPESSQVKGGRNVVVLSLRALCLDNWLSGRTLD